MGVLSFLSGYLNNRRGGGRLMYNCVLNKEKVTTLLEDVVFPLTEKIKNRVDAERVYIFQVALTKLSIILLLPDREKIRVLKDKGVSLVSLFIGDDEIDREIQKKFFELHSKWVELHCQTDEFFDFESEKVDDIINKMHYKDSEKIDAKTFMKSFMEDDLISDMQSYLKEFKNMTIFSPLDEDYLNDVKEIVRKFIYLLEISIEFKDLAKVFRKLEEMLVQIDIDKLENKEFIKLFIETIFTDIEKWMDEILIHQTATDIHYLDASLLASISQIEIMLKQEV